MYDDDDGELVSAMLAIVIAAVFLVVGELYIVNKPTALPTIFVPQQQLAVRRLRNAPRPEGAPLAIAAKYRRSSSGRWSMNGQSPNRAGNKRQSGGDL